MAVSHNLFVAKRRRKGDLTYPVPEWWLAKLDEWMEQKGVRQGQLAKMVGSSQSNISRLLGRGYEESADVAAICRVSGLPLPTIEADEKMQALVQVLKDFESLRPGTMEEEMRHFLARLADLKPQGG